MKRIFADIKPIWLRLTSKKEQILGKFLIENKLTCATAESCTGGLLSSRLTDVSGSSNYIKANFVTYSYKAKEDILGVKKETLDKYGAVSEECAKEMVQGLYKLTNCDLAIITTGIAGPLSDGIKPVGLVYVNPKKKVSSFDKTYKYTFTPYNY